MSSFKAVPVRLPSGFFSLFLSHAVFDSHLANADCGEMIERSITPHSKCFPNNPGSALQGS
jgi:hypothetical protein